MKSEIYYMMKFGLDFLSKIAIEANMTEYSKKQLFLLTVVYRYELIINIFENYISNELIISPFSFNLNEIKLEFEEKYNSILTDQMINKYQKVIIPVSHQNELRKMQNIVNRIINNKTNYDESTYKNALIENRAIKYKIELFKSLKNVIITEQEKRKYENTLQAFITLINEDSKKGLQKLGNYLYRKELQSTRYFIMKTYFKDSLKLLLTPGINGGLDFNNNTGSLYKEYDLWFINVQISFSLNHKYEYEHGFDFKDSYINERRIESGNIFVYFEKFFYIKENNEQIFDPYEIIYFLTKQYGVEDIAFTGDPIEFRMAYDFDPILFQRFKGIDSLKNKNEISLQLNVAKNLL